MREILGTAFVLLADLVFLIILYCLLFVSPVAWYIVLPYVVIIPICIWKPNKEVFLYWKKKFIR